MQNFLQIYNKNKNIINQISIDYKMSDIETENKNINNGENLKNDEAEFEYPSVSYFKLQFRLADCTDYVLYFISALGATGMGVCFPLFAILFGNIMTDLGITATEDLTRTIGDLAKKLLWVGFGMLGGTFFNIFFSIISGDRMTRKIKSAYFRALLKQDQSYFDRINAYEYSTKVESQLKIINSGLGQKVGNTIMSTSMFICAYVVAFVTSWKLSLVLLTVVPFMVLGGWGMVKALAESQSVGRKHFEEAGGVAEEILYGIKTVASFANFDFERKRFKEKVDESFEKGKYGGLISSLLKGLVFFLIFGTYALAVGVGAKFIHDKQLNSNSLKDNKPDLILVGDILTCLFTIVFGSFSLGQTFPNIKAISAACDASREFFYLLDRNPNIDLSNSVKKPEIIGNIKFEKVDFYYPSKPERKIIHSFTHLFKSGTSTAIVGETGSGKSTIITLIERLYDTSNGVVTIDDEPIKNINLEYLRSMIGYVQQEPILFNTSIRENIIFGRENVSEEEILEACKKAYVTDFLKNLEHGLDTKVGLKGSKLSGGQKQRVAIARAVLKKPKILILDEATSALDYKSEKIVKKALDEVSKSVTTIIIAHRLSTVRNADNIIVLNKGEISEIGNHNELFEKKGLYYLLVKNQETYDSQRREDSTSIDDDNIVLKENKNNESDKNTNLEVQNDKLPKGIIVYSVEDILKLPIANQKEALDHNKVLLESDELSLEIKKEIFDIEEKVKDKQLENSKSILWPIIFEKPCMLLTATFSVCVDGCVWPVYGLLLADVIFKLSYTNDSELPKVLDDGIFLSGMFLLMAGISGIANFSVGNLFNLMGENLAKSMRILCYNKYLSLHLGFYDYNSNSPGSLLTKLASDTLKINGVALSMFAILLSTLTTLILGIALSFSYSWQLALICLGFVPFIILAGAIGMKMQQGMAKTDEINEKELGNLLSECVVNTKTIFCFNMQDKSCLMYEEKINKGTPSYFSYFFSALLNGFSQFLMFGVYCLTFYVGSVLVAKKNSTLTFGEMLRSIFCLIFAAFGVGMAQQYIGDMSEASKSLISLNYIIQAKSEIDPEESEIEKKEEDTNKNDENKDNKDIKDNKEKNENVEKIKKVIADPNNFVSKIEFKNVYFHYPTRPETEIFKGISFVINQGDNCAFVGFSGSGKSTIIQLILRFYDVQKGEILINDINIKDYELSSLRKLIGFVMQEPVLFKRNVYSNILYGKLDANKEEVISAAKRSLVPRIEQVTEDNKDALPVSGGEKQRIAIARCMIREPKILLLDEATSALDKNTEEEVQKSIDKLIEGRTSIVIAHRLSTIINCNKIFFLEHGEIKEFGSHDELMKKQDRYYALYTSSGN